MEAVEKARLVAGLREVQLACAGMASPGYDATTQGLWELHALTTSTDPAVAPPEAVWLGFEAVADRVEFAADGVEALMSSFSLDGWSKARGAASSFAAAEADASIVRFAVRDWPWSSWSSRFSVTVGGPTSLDRQVDRAVLAWTLHIFAVALSDADLSTRAENVVKRAYCDLFEYLVLYRWLTNAPVDNF